jgi:hypothetical protein
MKLDLRYRSPVDLTQPEFQAELRRVIENSLRDFPQGADGVITLGGVEHHLSGPRRGGGGIRAAAQHHRSRRCRHRSTSTSRSEACAAMDGKIYETLALACARLGPGRFTCHWDLYLSVRPGRRDFVHVDIRRYVRRAPRTFQSPKVTHSRAEPPSAGGKSNVPHRHKIEVLLTCPGSSGHG